MQPTPQTSLQVEYDKLVDIRIKAVLKLQAIDKKLSELRGKLNGKY